MTVALRSELEKETPPNPTPAPTPPVPDPTPPAPVAPPIQEPTPPVETPEQKSHRLEIENAELRGKTSVLEKPPEPKEPAPMPRSQKELQWEQTKVLVNGHINSMSDEDFETHYKFNKATAQGQIVSGDNTISAEKTAERTTKIEAENKLYAKYGPEYAEVADEMTGIISDASPEVRNDPVRLAKFLERQFKAIRKPKKEEPPAPPAPPGDPMQRRITNFDTPNPIPAPPAKEGETKKTPVDPSMAHITKAFGIESEEERKQYESPNIRMDLGRSGGKNVVFRDPKKGFERI